MDTSFFMGPAGGEAQNTWETPIFPDSPCILLAFRHAKRPDSAAMYMGNPYFSGFPMYFLGFQACEKAGFSFSRIEKN